jgi:hypothetical protein
VCLPHALYSDGIDRWILIFSIRGFRWDPGKARRNLAKHRISFEDAKTVFDDTLYLVFADPDSPWKSIDLSSWENRSGNIYWWLPTPKKAVRPESSVLGRRPGASERFMKKAARSRQGDELRPEYDFRTLPVVARGPGRKEPPARTVRLSPDVAEAFPDSDSVNRALRLLIRVAESRALRRPRPQSTKLAQSRFEP